MSSNARLAAVAAALFVACSSDDGTETAQLIDGGGLRDTGGSGLDAAPTDSSGLTDSATGDPAADTASTADTATGAGRAGDPCTSGADCVNGRCVPESDGFPGGFCTTPACGNGTQCSGDLLCATHEDIHFCTPRCIVDAECREGYRCININGPANAGCAPIPPVVPQPDGAACTEDRECRSGTCLPDPEWPGGYCTRLDCRELGCSLGPSTTAACLQIGDGPTQCYQTCGADACRPGYECDTAPGGATYCTPIVVRHVEDTTPEPDVPTYPPPLTPQCVPHETSGSDSLTFEVPTGTTSYLANVYSTGTGLNLRSLAAPDGQRLNFEGDDYILTVGEQFFDAVVPVMLPQLPQYANFVQAGTHTLVFSAGRGEVCVELATSDHVGGLVDLNIYLVGVPGITSANAAGATNLQEVLQAVDAILGPAGVHLGTVRYYDTDARTTALYEIARSSGQIQRMVAEAVLPGPTVSDALSLNVFFVKGFAFPEGTVIGLSAGIPGASGTYGTRASGLAFTSEFLGQSSLGDAPSGNYYTGLVMAHEMGHYLGLFHVLELDGATEDPLDDTPTCSSVTDRSCDANNYLMFPIAWGNNIELSPKEMAVLAANPVVK